MGILVCISITPFFNIFNLHFTNTFFRRNIAFGRRRNVGFRGTRHIAARGRRNIAARGGRIRRRTRLNNKEQDKKET